MFDSRFPFAEQVYESVIKVAESPPQVPIPLDIKVKKTIAQIFYDFFSDKERVIIYICDTADSRHRARFRKFSSWFEEFKLNQFVTVNTSISDPLHPLQLVYLNALILHRNNPHFVEIIDAFRKVTGGYSEEK
ncbi:MAG: hypothetical protein EAZ32_07665 [Cytophagia bacterium]|nr:MAG: hypothetical protein EAZ46_04595 [Runella sp.]TAG20950.1 MAG: hypothetical protein EAZ38_09085 [Cytophagales bacterium]TAG40107.1 MAG: hypothetical protein EAZ32_07665 [Cytophagia bacterium]TAG81747.1 MAG: hypothetical protein EAZ22_06515 [Cytophagales bacterium]